MSHHNHHNHHNFSSLTSGDTHITCPDGTTPVGGSVNVKVKIPHGPQFEFGGGGAHCKPINKHIMVKPYPNHTNNIPNTHIPQQPHPHPHQYILASKHMNGNINGSGNLHSGNFQGTLQLNHGQDHYTFSDTFNTGSGHHDYNNFSGTYKHDFNKHSSVHISGNTDNQGRWGVNIGSELKF